MAEITEVEVMERADALARYLRSDAARHRIAEIADFEEKEDREHAADALADVADLVDYLMGRTAEAPEWSVRVNDEQAYSRSRWALFTATCSLIAVAGSAARLVDSD